MTQDELYLRAIAEFGPALARLVSAYEPDADQRRDLLQDVHFALWRSFASFAGQCSLRTWIYRVAQNTAISAAAPTQGRLVSLEELAEAPAPDNPENAVVNARALARWRFDPAPHSPDDQVMLLYLEDIDAASIAEITGLSARAVATRIHRIKALLSRQFRQGGTDE